MSLALVTLTLVLTADDGRIAPEKAAAIELQHQKAQAEVWAKYGNRKLSEMSQEERRQLAKDQAAAERDVLEKNGIDAKTWARQSVKKDREEYAEAKALEKELAEKQKAEEEARKKAADGPKEVEVQRGITDATPVTLDEKPNDTGKVAVEEGLPPEVLQELGEVAAEDGQTGAEVTREEASKPAPRPAKGGGKRR